MKSILIILLRVLAFYLADRLVREENQRYALLLGMCQKQSALPPVSVSVECLSKVQTRTSWLWHLFYAVTDDLPGVPLSSK